jgi:hypothetical protein
MRGVRSRHGEGRADRAVNVQTSTAGRSPARGRVRTDGANTATTGGQVVGEYRDRDGIRRLVVVRHPDVERWEVCEIAEHEERRVIEELSGPGESKRTAVALARDYLHVQRRRLAA